MKKFVVLLLFVGALLAAAPSAEAGSRRVVVVRDHCASPVVIHRRHYPRHCYHRYYRPSRVYYHDRYYHRPRVSFAFSF